MKKRPDYPGVIANLCALTGVVLLCIAAGSTIQTQRFLSGARTAPGAVIEIVQSQDNDGNRTFAPKVRYVADGQRHEFVSILAFGWPVYHVGQEVSVLYDPAAPGKGRIDSWWGHYYVAVVSAFFGIVFSALGIGYLIIEHRRGSISR